MLSRFTTCFLAFALSWLFFSSLANATECRAQKNKDKRASPTAEGRLALEELTRSNDALAQSPRLSIQQLVQQGYIRLGSANVQPIGRENTQERLSVVEILFPQAFTGVYVNDYLLDQNDRGNIERVLQNAFKPTLRVQVENKNWVDQRFHRGILVFAPGNGSDHSTAKSVVKIASAFHRKPASKGKKVAIVDGGLKMASFAMDLPGNGMGIDAPVDFLSEMGLGQVFRHVRLVLKHVYGDLPFFFAGRSHGASASLGYGHFFNDVTGVIGMNPQIPERELIDNMIRNLESPDIMNTLFGRPVKLHWHSWIPAKYFWYSYEFHKTKSQVPELLLIGQKDPTFSQVLAIDNSNPNDPKAILSSVKARLAIKNYLHAQPDRRQALIVAGGHHNLWDKDAAEIYRQVIEKMVEFMQPLVDHHEAKSSGH